MKIKVSELLPCLEKVRKGALREAFPGEEPDFVQGHDKECTGITFIKWGFSVDFDPPVFLAAGQGYVFEEAADEN